MAVCLSASLIAVAAPAYADTLSPAPAPSVIVSGTGVTKPARYTLADLQTLAGADATKSYTYSSRNDYDFYRTYTASGVSLSTVLAASGATLDSSITLVAGDGMSLTFAGTTGDMPALSQTRYCFPNANSGDVDASNHWVSGQGSPYTDGAEEVDPILSWSATYVTADPGSSPTQTPITVTNQPRLLIGQLDPQDYNTAKYLQTTGGTTQIIVGAPDNTTALTVGSTTYTAQKLLSMDAVTANFSYVNNQAITKTDATMGVPLASLLTSVGDDDMVSFDTTDHFETIGDYSMTKAELIAKHAVLAYAKANAGDPLAPVGPNPTLYVDGMMPAKFLNTVTITPAPAALTVTSQGAMTGVQSYTMVKLKAITPISGLYTYTNNQGFDKQDYVLGAPLSALLASFPDDAQVSFDTTDHYKDIPNYSMTKAELVAAGAVLAYQKGTSADDLAPVVNGTDPALTLYVQGMMPAKLLDTVMVAVTAPATPQLLSLTNSATGPTLKWSKVAGAAGYIVYRKTGTNSFSSITTIASGSVTSYTDTTAVSGTSYTYTVRAYKSPGTLLGGSDTTGLTVVYVAMPKLVSAVNTTTGVKFTWAKVSGATGYVLLRKTGTGGWSSLKTIASATTVSYVDTTAKSGTSYAYSARAYKTSTANLSSYNTTGKAVVYVAAPKLVSAVNTTTGVKFTWGKVTGATGYIVWRKTGTGAPVKIKTITSGATVSYLDKTVKSGTTYTYTVYAYKSSSANISSYNAGKKVIFLSTPVLKSLVNSKSGPVLKWGKVTGATGYYVYRKTTGGWVKIATIKSGATVSYTDKKAAKGKTYRYTVRAYKSSSANVSSINATGFKIKVKK